MEYSSVICQQLGLTSMAVLFSKPLNFRWMMLFLMTILAFLLVLVQFYAVPPEVSSFDEFPPGEDVLLPLSIDLPILREVATVSTSLDASLNQHNDLSEKNHLQTNYDVKSKHDDGDETAILVDEDDEASRKALAQKGRMIRSDDGLSSNASSTAGETFMDDFNAIDAKLLENSSSMSIINETFGSNFKRSTSPLPRGKSDWSIASVTIEKFIRKMRGPTIPFSEINSMLLKTQAFSNFERAASRTTPHKKSALLSAKSRIRNAPPIKTNDPELHPDLFRNISMFQRSYELMERTLKIYIYKEGEKPIFHHPRLRGIYSSEGWFMKQLKTSRRYTVKDPRKAHLFYLPFSSETLRQTVGRANGTSLRKLENYLKDYVESIRSKYHFWNRTGGADHFFVGCHDWAPRITRQHMSNCIQALCNANIARGFTLGKDVSVPVTYIRSGNNPLRDIGGNPPSERRVLAFFAGGMHGYLRPILLQYWGNNKSPDMKIFGQMERTIEGKAVYRDYMKTSKYCICARGYGVHTPRVVESIYYECVPVIISDNYVPPLFEVLDWSSFSVFVLEKDVPSLREILVSIPESRYLEMQQRIRMVKRHFLWHKVPEKYDLFHMILHSIWFNRVFQI